MLDLYGVQYTCYENNTNILRVNGPHNVGDPHNAGLGK